MVAKRIFARSMANSATRDCLLVRRIQPNRLTTRQTNFWISL